MFNEFDISKFESRKAEFEAQIDGLMKEYLLDYMPSKSNVDVERIKE